jgi:hypothetical protein
MAKEGGSTPPGTHNLIHLVTIAKAELSESQLEFIAVLYMYKQEMTVCSKNLVKLE